MTEELLQFAWGRPGVVEEFLTNPDKRVDMQSHYLKIQQYWTKKEPVKLYKQLQQVEKSWQTQRVIDALLIWLQQKKDFSSADQVIKTLRMRQSNVAIDTLLFSLACMRQ